MLYHHETIFRQPESLPPNMARMLPWKLPAIVRGRFEVPYTGPVPEPRTCQNSRSWPGFLRNDSCPVPASDLPVLGPPTTPTLAVFRQEGFAFLGHCVGIYAMLYGFLDDSDEVAVIPVRG